MGKSNRRMTIKKAPRKSGLKTVDERQADRAVRRSIPRRRRQKQAARAARADSSIILPEGYRPSENEPFMNERHRTYFRNKLVAWKEEIIRQNRETLHILHEDSAQHADLADRATSETDRALELQGPRPPAQADRQDRRRAGAHRGGHLRLLRGDGRAHRPEAPRRAAHRHAVARSPGASRAAREGVPRRLGSGSAVGNSRERARRNCLSTAHSPHSPATRLPLLAARRWAAASSAALPARSWMYWVR